MKSHTKNGLYFGMKGQSNFDTFLFGYSDHYLHSVSLFRVVETLLSVGGGCGGGGLLRGRGGGSGAAEGDDEDEGEADDHEVDRVQPRVAVGVVEDPTEHVGVARVQLLHLGYKSDT